VLTQDLVEGLQNPDKLFPLFRVLPRESRHQDGCVKPSCQLLVGIDDGLAGWEPGDHQRTTGFVHQNLEPVGDVVHDQFRPLVEEMLKLIDHQHSGSRVAHQVLHPPGSFVLGAAGRVCRSHSLQQDFGKTFYGWLRWGGYAQDGNVHSILTTDLGMLPFANV